MGRSDKESASSKHSSSKSNSNVPKADAPRSSNGAGGDVPLVPQGTDRQGPSAPATSPAVVAGVGSKPGHAGLPAGGTSGAGRGCPADLRGRHLDVGHGGNNGLAQLMASPPVGAVNMQQLLSTIQRLESNIATLTRQQQPQQSVVYEGFYFKTVQTCSLNGIFIDGPAVAVATSVHDTFSTDEEEFDMEGNVREFVDDEQDDDYEEQEVSSRFSGKNSRRVPEPMQSQIWGQARCVSSEYSEEDWKLGSQNALIKCFTAHPSAAMFSAPAADAQCPDLKYKEKRNIEKQVLFLLVNLAISLSFKF